MTEQEPPKRGRGRPPGRGQGRQTADVTVQLTHDLIGRLDTQAATEGMTRSALIRAFCEEGLRRAAKRAGKEQP